ncbi:unnamed protein product [Fraxinus pennsylvanica]|uniref:Uncharacterized protein n=1 Tax=Fraxinus pennsylvanica TaxID=56036 RepID=A0AAD2DHQ0_9LAMI|nr:unnamed protein product [Fraxinus pennsylvanica]
MWSGQDPAVRSVAEASQRSREGLSDPDRYILNTDDDTLPKEMAYETMKKRVMEAARLIFSPEFMNRVDNPALDLKQISSIVMLQLAPVGSGSRKQLSMAQILDRVRAISGQPPPIDPPPDFKVRCLKIPADPGEPPMASFELCNNPDQLVHSSVSSSGYGTHPQELESCKLAVLC